MTATVKTDSLRYDLLRRGIDISFDDANALRRAAKTLQRWSENECGNSDNYKSWAIERDEEDTANCTQCGHNWYGDTALTHNCPKCGDPAPIRHKATDKPFMVIHPHDGSKTIRHKIADREAGALKRVGEICKRNGLHFYHQGDPRGCPLFIAKEKLDQSNYNNGVAICA